MKLKFFKFSLRSKMVITLSLVVTTVSLILIYFTSKMIIEDKRAYLYDSAYLSLDNGYTTLEQFFQGKRNYANIFQNLPGRIEDVDKKQFEADPDLFEVSYITYYEDNKSPEGIYTVYKNKKISNQYKRKDNVLVVPESFFVESGRIAKAEGVAERLFYKKGRAPRLLIFVYQPKVNRVLCFDFLLEQIYNNVFSKQSFEISLVNRNGDLIFHNRPQESDGPLKKFFKDFIEDKTKDSNIAKNGGVNEQKIGDMDYIMGFKQLSRFPDHFLFSGIKTVEAYEVTSVLLINTIVYTLSLLAIFNLISILIARSITNPLEKLVKIIKKISSGEYDVRVGAQSTTELEQVGDAFNEMVDKIQEYQKKLLEYNKNLEQKVEERTEKLKKANNFIKTMVDSLGQGLVVFDRNGICLELHTKACIPLLGTNPTGKQLGKIIKAQDQELLKEWILNLFEELIPFESLVDLGQKSIPTKYQYTAPEFKHVTLEFFPMRDDEGKIQNVVMVASDKTNEFKASKEIEAQKNYVRLVTKVLKDKVNFRRTMTMFDQALRLEKEKVFSGNPTPKDDFMRLLHSMKGSAGFYALQELVTLLHDFETEIDADKISGDDVIKRIDEVLEKLASYNNRLKEVIGETTHSSVEVEESVMREFFQYLHQRNKDAAAEFRNKFLNRRVSDYIEQYKVLVLDLALRLNKKIKPLEIENGHIPVDMNYLQEFFDSCIHIFRNAVDHAIEYPEIRTTNGKEVEGTIHVSFNIVKSDEVSLLEFTVRDDGAGIDAQRIRRKMQDLGYPEDMIQKNDHQILYHIFDPNFSTADQVSDISGRGVGLYDIKKNIEKLNGTIEVETKLGKGTAFTFIIPLPA